MKFYHALPLLFAFFSVNFLNAQDTLRLPAEDDYYRIIKVPIPEGVVLEVGGLCTLNDGNLAASTRRGDVWVIENPSSVHPNYRRFATGLHEVLGLASKDGQLYCAQRGELTRLIDRNGDGIADRYETVFAWPLSGHYHEYSFGPKVTPEGDFIVTGNVSFGATDWWSGKSFVPWRGWAMKISPDGTMKPYAAGMRSPCGIGMVNGEFFYGDNQGDWMGSGFVTNVEEGDFLGHPASLVWADRPESPVKMRSDLVFKQVAPRDDPKVKPEYIADEPETTIYEMGHKTYPYQHIKSPAVYLPHGILGVSTSEILPDETQGGFGPFAGQLFVGDQGMSKIARVFLEKVNGQWQGASFDFRSGFRSGVLRMCWADDGGTMYVGGTNRGWGSTGKEPYGLERLVWTGQMPFEMRAVRAMPDGFEIEFTQPVDKATAQNVDNYTVNSFTYKYHPVYGSPTIRMMGNAVLGAKASSDGLRVRLVVDSLREGYIHNIQADGVRSYSEETPLLHPAAYYTLNSIPGGEKASFPLAPKKAKTTNKSVGKDSGNAANNPDNQMKEARPSTLGESLKSTAPAKSAAKSSVISDSEAKAMMIKYTCSACHKPYEKMVGPAYSEVAKRKYTVAQIVALVYNPKPEHWPEYTPMAPMLQVPKQDVEKIAAWINTLKK